MDVRTGLLLTSGLALLGVGAGSSTPPNELIGRLASIVDRRFADVETGRFGVTRLGEPYNTHKYGQRLMEPENATETRLVNDLNKSGWSAVVYTVRATELKLARSGGKGPLRRSVALNAGAVNGPALVTADSRPLPTVGAIDQELTKLAGQVRAGRRSTFEYKGWSFVARKVSAERACVSCHMDATGRPIRVGETVGYYLMGFKKKGEE